VKTSLDCMPCLLRQALDAARLVSADAAVHEGIVREVLRLAADMDLESPPPVLAQLMHRRLREIVGVDDPYREAKERLNRMALAILPDLQAEIASAEDPLETAIRLAISGNVIDMGVNGRITEQDVRRSVRKAITEPFSGGMEGFRRSAKEAGSILYLADNAGEVVFDRLLIERISPEKVTVAVRGAPVINDATLADAEAAGLADIVEVIDNGSDAPGTILPDCSGEFRRRFDSADLIIAKGQGNFETLGDEWGRDIFFLFQAKCPVIAARVGLPVGTNVLAGPGAVFVE